MKQMEVSAKLNYLRIAPRKVRLVADAIRGKRANEAEAILNFAVKKASLPLLKLLKSAIANAKNNFQLEESNLYIQKILVNEGPKLKRWRPRARGSAYEIQKKTSHITIVLGQIKERAEKTGATKAAKERKAEIPEKIGEIAAAQKPKFRPEPVKEKPKLSRGINRIFRRKAF